MATCASLSLSLSLLFFGVDLVKKGPLNCGSLLVVWLERKAKEAKQ
ncbi:hypothetical protein AMTRI_Chr02g264390 [Amborella trichopoda]